MNVRSLIVVLVGSSLLCGLSFACGSTALAARAHLPAGTFGGPCTTEPCGNGQLKEPEGVAVNEATGDVYVADKGDDRVEYFSSSGTYLGKFNGSGLLPGEGTGAPTGQLSSPTTVVVDNACQLHQPALSEATTPTCHEFDPSNGDVYVLDVGHHLVDKFTATGKYLNQITAHNASVQFPFILGMSVDQNGFLWALQYGESVTEGTTPDELNKYSDGEVNGFLSSWRLPGAALSETVPAFVVEPKGSSYYLYIGPFASPPERWRTSESGLLVTREERIGSEVSTGLANEVTTHDLYVDTGSMVTRYSSALAPLEQIGSGTLGEGSGVGVDNANEDLYIADSTADDVKMFVPRPPGAPTIASETVSSVTAESAAFNGAVDPEGFNTRYRVEYGPTTEYGQSAPSTEEDVGSDYEVHEVSVHVQGLLPNTIYHFRVVATNALGVEYGKDETFTTQETGIALTLPDGRQWEMVSPPYKNGALFLGARGVNGGGSPVGAAANGDAFVGLASQPTEDGAEGNSGWVDVFMTRGSEGWSSQVIAPAHAQGTLQTSGSEYAFFSEDLSHGLVRPYGLFTPLSPEATEATPYLRTDYLGNDVNDRCTSGCYQPLLTKNNTAPGVEFGERKVCIAVVCGAEFLAATPDLSHVLIGSNVQLTSEPAPNGGAYEWSNGVLRLVSGEQSVAGGRIPFSKTVEQRFGMQAISSDGERVILGGSGTAGIYLHEMSTGVTTRLDEPERGVGPSELPQFAGASSDASKVFFIDGGRLTATSSASGTDLYEYDMGKPAGERLTDLTVDVNSGEAANVQVVFGESKDDSYIYFVARGVLASGASPGENVYVRHDGVTSFVTHGWNGGVELTRVSPDGHWLAFMSSTDLTGYDSHDANTGRPDQEVYLYDALGKHLTCASCDPTKARPVGAPLFESVADVAGGLPAWARDEHEVAWPYQPRYLSDSGRLFFNSFDALVSQDIDGTEDVYEFEPVGVGSCTEGTSGGTSVYVPSENGCTSLISSGTSSDASSFVDASESGADVFFRTAAKLQPQDFDSAMDIYDAHECSDAVPCPPAAPVLPPSCATGDACKPAPTPQPGLFGPAPSETFSGAGNAGATAAAPSVKPRPLTKAQKLSRALRACRGKRPRKRRLSCEAAARKSYGSKMGKAKARKRGGR